MTNLEQRIIRLEQLATAQADNNIRIWAAIAALQQAVRTTQQGAYGGGGSGGTTPLYFATNSGSVGPATGSTVAGITPASFTSNIYTNVSGAETLVASSQTVYWWYLDTAPANSLIAVLPCQSGTAGWDAVAGGCTAL